MKKEGGVYLVSHYGVLVCDLFYRIHATQITNIEHYFSFFLFKLICRWFVCCSGIVFQSKQINELYDTGRKLCFRNETRKCLERSIWLSPGCENLQFRERNITFHIHFRLPLRFLLICSQILKKGHLDFLQAMKARRTR